MSNARYGTARSHARRLYRHTLKRLGTPYVTKAADQQQNHFLEYVQDSLYAQRFEGMNWSDSTAVKQYVLRALVNRYSEDQVLNFIMERTDATRGQARRIWRQEGHELQVKAREYAYRSTDEEGAHLYKWDGPKDRRTTPICYRITQRTKGGVTMDELKTIIQEEVANAKANGELPSYYDAREYSPHFSCRHDFWRLI